MASQQVDELEARGPTGTIAEDERREENCFKIMLATDNHIGYNEKDPIRGQDSINTFREILEIARERQVDFILLAGDLFHENKPSRTCLHQTLALLREFTLGDRPVSMELLSDPMEGKTPGFSFPAVNYEDPNLNVAIPVFSIHGNHDDPQGTGPEGALCALDVLSVAGVLNYFGKVNLAADAEAANPETDGMQIRPVLLQKGSTRLAMYGVGNVKDTRMHYELRSNRVRMFMPEEDEDGPWFNLLLVHQNRVNHGPQSAVPESMFDDSVDLVVWGHEHDCRIEPERVQQKPYFITQPGSSVATSLAHGEAIQKKVGILYIQGDQFDIEPVVLKTVRPFKIHEVVLTEAAEDEANGIDLSQRETITQYLQMEVNQLIAAAEEEWHQEGHDRAEKMPLPLIRLKVETTGAREVINAARFGQQFAGKIANPKDVVQYHRKKAGATKREKVAADAPDFDEMEEDTMGSGNASQSLSKLRMQELVMNYLQAQQLDVLAASFLEDAVTRYVEKDDTDAIKDFVYATMDTMDKNTKKMADRSSLVDDKAMKQAIANGKEAVAEDLADRPIKKGAAKAAAKKKQRADSDESMLDDDDDDRMAVDDSDAASVASRSTTGRGSRGGKSGAAAARGVGGKKAAAPKKAAGTTGRGKKQALFVEDSDDDDEEPAFVPRAERAPRAAPPAAKKQPAANATGPGAGRKAAAAASAASGSGSRQSQLSFAPRGGARNMGTIELSDSE